LSSVPEPGRETSPAKPATSGPSDRPPPAAGAGRCGIRRGLEIPIGGASETELAQLPVGAIHPNPRQPRKRHDPEAAHGLADSVRVQGVIQPIVVRSRAAGGWELIAGERRWRAAREAGLPTVPAVVREADDRDSLLLALVENVAREQLSPVEEARACALLIDDFGLTLGDVSERVGRSKPSVSNRMRLLDLSDDVLALVERGELSEGHARAVLAVPDQEGRRRLAREIVKTGMSVRAAEQKARWAGARQKPRTKAAPLDPALSARVRASAERLTGLPVRLVRGRLEVLFADEYELAELAEALERHLGAA
jgi:ParB family transcriptional regulator, chromosome partitioning protein